MTIVPQKPIEYSFKFNVLDKLKHLTQEEVKQYVKNNSFKAQIVVNNVFGDFNFASVIRNANSFGFNKVYNISPKKKYDKRATLGTENYTEVLHCTNLEELIRIVKNDYTWVALENNIDYEMISLYEFKWPEKTLLFVGEENAGLPNEILNRCDHIVTIPQYGSVRSINLSTASGIAMADYARQWSK